MHVSAIGAPHVVDPERLERSARRLYGDAFDPLWGALEPVPAENIDVVGDHAVGLEVFPTPGHASHHVSYLTPDGTLHAGDAVGVRIQPGRYVFPAAPATGHRPRGLGADAATRSSGAPPGTARTDPLRRRDDTVEHVERVREELARAAERVRSGMSQDEFLAARRADIAASDERRRPYYERAGPIWQTYLGLKRYWEKRAEAPAMAQMTETVSFWTAEPR